MTKQILPNHKPRVLSLLWKLCFYFKVKNYCSHTDKQILEAAVDQICRMKSECEKKHYSPARTDKVCFSASD